MPVPTHLLERAYQLINANQLQNAGLVLDAVVRVDPQNVGAWKTYLQIHQNQNDLDWLKERLLKTKELSEADKAELINYHLHLTQQLNGSKEASIWADTFVPLPPQETQETITAKETNVRFELIDVFDYPARMAKKEPRTRPRRRTMRNSLARDIANGVLKAVSRRSTGKKLATYIQKITALANEFVKNPKDAYLRFSKSPHFEKPIGIGLLTLFVMGIRLAVSSYIFGYVLLGMFVIGSGWWLVNFGSQGANQSRVYLHENKINLPVIEEAEMDQEEESGTE